MLFHKKKENTDSDKMIRIAKTTPNCTVSIGVLSAAIGNEPSGSIITSTYFGDSKPQVVILEIPLAYRDWCKVQASKIWAEFSLYLENLAK